MLRPASCVAPSCPAISGITTAMACQNERMAEDAEWNSVYAVVLEALADGAVLERPPRQEHEVGFLAEKISDHIVAAFKTEPRRQ